jgi:hypothetical protein
VEESSDVLDTVQAPVIGWDGYVQHIEVVLASRVRMENKALRNHLHVDIEAARLAAAAAAAAVAVQMVRKRLLI